MNLKIQKKFFLYLFSIILLLGDVGVMHINTYSAAVGGGNGGYDYLGYCKKIYKGCKRGIIVVRICSTAGLLYAPSPYTFGAHCCVVGVDHLMHSFPLARDICISIRDREFSSWLLFGGILRLVSIGGDIAGVIGGVDMLGSTPEMMMCTRMASDLQLEGIGSVVATGAARLSGESIAAHHADRARRAVAEAAEQERRRLNILIERVAEVEAEALERRQGLILGFIIAVGHENLGNYIATLQGMLRRDIGQGRIEVIDMIIQRMGSEQ